jgi:hypothetical protein
LVAVVIIEVRYIYGTARRPGRHRMGDKLAWKPTFECSPQSAVERL